MTRLPLHPPLVGTVPPGLLSAAADEQTAMGREARRRLFGAARARAAAAMEVELRFRAGGG